MLLLPRAFLFPPYRRQPQPLTGLALFSFDEWCTEVESHWCRQPKWAGAGRRSQAVTPRWWLFYKRPSPLCGRFPAPVSDVQLSEYCRICLCWDFYSAVHKHTGDFVQSSSRTRDEIVEFTSLQEFNLFTQDSYHVFYGNVDLNLYQQTRPFNNIVSV